MRAGAGSDRDSGIIAPLLSRRAPLQVSALRLRGHPVRLAQVSPAAPPPGAEERSRPRATPGAAAPFPAGFGPVVRSHAASSSDCYLCAKLHLPSKILDFLMPRNSFYSDAIAVYYYILPIVAAQRMFVE